MALPKYLLYTAYADRDPGCWYPEDVQCYPRLEDAVRHAERLRKQDGSTPTRIAIYQLVEVIKEAPERLWQELRAYDPAKLLAWAKENLPKGVESEVDKESEEENI